MDSAGIVDELLCRPPVPRATPTAIAPDMVARELGKWPVDRTDYVDLIMSTFVDRRRVVVEVVMNGDAAFNELLLGEPIEHAIVNGALSASAALEVGRGGLAKLPVYTALDGQRFGHAGIMGALV